MPSRSTEKSASDRFAGVERKQTDRVELLRQLSGRELAGDRDRTAHAHLLPCGKSNIEISLEGWERCRGCRGSKVCGLGRVWVLWCFGWSGRRSRPVPTRANAG